MLKKLTVKNFKSFKNETVFDFTKTDYKLLEQNVCGDILKGALFVGGNASGKTNAIQPVMILLGLLFRDQYINLLPLQCFFSEERKTRFKYEFVIDGHDIVYSYSFSANDIVEESLFLDKDVIIKRGRGYSELYLDNEQYSYNTDPSLLFLRQVYFNTRFSGNEVLIKWFEFLKNSVFINACTKETHFYNNEDFRCNMYISKNGEEQINNFLKKYNFDYTIKYTNLTGIYGLLEFPDENGKAVYFEKEGINVPVPFMMESAGNQNLLNLLPVILHSVKRGGMLLIDEFSSGLHNKLEELLVRYIMENGINTQLFFVSHSTNLLSCSLLRPDQIYILEMNGNEGSRISRLSDENPRVSQNLEKMYLSGVFGGIPEYETE